MKTLLKISFLFLLTFNLSCASKKVLTPAEIKMMTTKQYEVNFEDVFKSTMSLLQSEQFSIEESDQNSGLIIASRNIYKKKNATFTKSTIIVDKINENLTEVKLTVYAGTEKVISGGYSERRRRVENMIEDPEYYNKWFNNLQAEISRRQALR